MFMNVPFRHGRHPFATSVAPAALPYRPTGHFAHDTLPVLALYDPFSHSSHAAPLDEYLPGAQLTHSDVCAAGACPSPHGFGAHRVAPVPSLVTLVVVVPSAHFEHAVAIVVAA